MEIKIKQREDGLFSIETEDQIASRLMWHEMLALISRITVPDSQECLVWLNDKDLLNEER